MEHFPKTKLEHDNPKYFEHKLNTKSSLELQRLNESIQLIPRHSQHHLSASARKRLSMD